MKRKYVMGPFLWIDACDNVQYTTLYAAVTWMGDA